MVKCRVRLSEAEFGSLVRGEEITVPTKDAEIHIILADIGFDRMSLQIMEALAASLNK